jgi:hypothetical protein
MKFSPLISLLAVTAALFSVKVAQADGTLRDYKNQVHKEHTEQVTSDNCSDEYKKSCKAKCSPGDAGCLASCDQTAEQFCKDRQKRKTEKEIEEIGKGLTLGVGAAGILFDSKMQEVVPGKDPISPYAIFWNEPSFSLELGGGAVQAGAKAGAVWTAFKDGFWGISGDAEYLFQNSDYLMQSDIGPTLYLGSSHIIAGFQPSLLINAANGASTLYGGGLRALSTYVNDQIMIEFNPLLGYINSQWMYQLKISGSYRFTPRFYVSLAVEHQDILDLNDLDISNSALEAVYLYLGFRIN